VTDRTLKLSALFKLVNDPLPLIAPMVWLHIQRNVAHFWPEISVENEVISKHTNQTRNQDKQQSDDPDCSAAHHGV